MKIINCAYNGQINYETKQPQGLGICVTSSGSIYEGLFIDGSITVPYVMNNFSGNIAKVHFKKKKGNKTRYIITFKNNEFVNGLKQTTFIINE